MLKVVGIAISFVLLVSICGNTAPTFVSLLSLELATTRLTGYLLRLPSQIHSESKLSGFPRASSFVGSIIPHSRQRNGLWTHFRALASSVTKPWSIIGDFNVNLLNRDCKGCSSSSSPDSAFQYMVFDCGLHDLDYSGFNYTWYRGNCSVPFDRCFGNSAWFEKFSTSVLHHLLRMKSDHRPILLSPSLMTPPSWPPPFRYFSGWSLHHDFK
ncbi:hypothetical protein GQ457_12G007130 [Hibiscus cannabinus]